MKDLQVTVPRQPAPLRFTYWISVLWVVVAAGFTIYTVLVDLLSSSVPASFSVGTFWPKVNPTMKLDGVTGVVTGGGFDHATFQLAGLGLDTRLLYASSTLVEGLASCALGVTIALLCSRVAKGDPFDRVVPRAFNISGGIVLVGGLAWQVLDQIAGMRAIIETFQATSASWTIADKGATLNSASWPTIGNSFNVSFWPVAAALGLFAIAVVLRYGAKVSQDRALLAEEVKGLV